MVFTDRFNMRTSIRNIITSVSTTLANIKNIIPVLVVKAVNIVFVFFYFSHPNFIKLFFFEKINSIMSLPLFRTHYRLILRQEFFVRSSGI